MTNKRRLIIIITVIMGFILILMIISRLGSGPKKPSSATKKNTVTNAIDVTKYANSNSKVILTVDGRINGDDQHRAIRITVDENMRTAEIIQGFEGYVINTQTAVNYPAAYEKFIFAISRYGFSKERKTTLTDDRGVCPLGQRYIYEIYENDRSVMRRWATSCGNLGTLAGNPTQINELFQRQVTDYSKFVSKVQL